MPEEPKQSPETELSPNIIPRPIEEEMRTSYIDYSMSVIVGRALPDVRDGLKPVHRRILYTMREMGLKHTGPYKKSARVVGECFVKDTLVVTSKGLTPIQNVQKGDLVYTQNGMEKVTELYEMPERELVKVTLENGFYNIVTRSQMFKVIDENLEFKWKEAKDLTENDYLVTRSVFPEINEYLSLPHLDGTKPCLNENIGYLLGQLISDGWIERGYARGKGFRVGFCSSSAGVIKRIQRILEEDFGYKSKIEEKKENNEFKTVYCIRINSLEINDYIVSVFGLENAYADTKSIPPQIFNSPKEVIFAFVSGLIDGDGSIHGSRNVIHYGSTSEKLINELMVLLQCFGIIGNKYSDLRVVRKGGNIGGKEVKARYPFHYLEFRGRNAVWLGSLLNLGDITKDKAVKRISFNEVNNPIKSDIIPFAGKRIFAELSRLHIGAGWYLGADGKKFRMGIKYPTGCKIRYSRDLKEKNLGKVQIENWQIRNKLNKIGSPLAEFIDDVFQNGLSFLRVKKIEAIPAERTFDIQVENSHEFIANGMLSHNCLGKFHPHGDMAVYESMVRMAQDFSLRYPLVDGQGNFGSIDGDPPAAMRYTEVRLKEIAEEVLRDLDKDTVDFVPNYDGSLTEPVVLPAVLPNLLVNGSSGIAVGMATNIPTHNLGEVVDGIVALINNPEIGVDELIKIIKGPDFPTGGIINGRQGIKDYFATGRGSIKIRAKAEIEELKGGRQAIIIRELPYQVNKAQLLETIAELVREKKLDDISDLRDESDRDGIRVVIEIKRDGNAQIVLNQLFKHTQLEVSFGVIMLALVNNRPKILNMKEMLESYLDFRREVVRRRTAFELAKAEARAHILEGLKIALDHLDSVIKTIRESKDTETARVNLMTRFKLTKVQAQAILDMKLQQLTGLERKKIEEEYLEIIKTIERLKLILSDPKRILKIIEEELLALKEKYGDERRTKIQAKETELDIEDLVADEDVVVTISYAGYIKRLPVDTYRAQRRGGKGVTGIAMREEDFVEHLFIARTHSYMLLFTNRGRAYWLRVFEIPEAGRTAKGKAIVNLVQLQPGEKITAAIPVRDFQENLYLFMATSDGTVKKTALSEFANPRRGGIIAINLKENNSLIDVKLTDGKQEIILATKNGIAIRFKENEVRPIGRSGQGVRGIKLSQDDVLVGAEVVSPKDVFLTATENGYGKRTEVGKYRLQSRGGKGVRNIKTTERNGFVVGIKKVSSDDEIMVMTEKGMAIRLFAKDVSIIGRNVSGVRLVRLEEGDRVAAIAVVAKEEDEDQKTPAS